MFASCCRIQLLAYSHWAPATAWSSVNGICPQLSICVKPTLQVVRHSCVSYFLSSFWHFLCFDNIILSQHYNYILQYAAKQQNWKLVLDGGAPEESFPWSFDPLVWVNTITRHKVGVISRLSQFNFPRFLQVPIYQSSRGEGWTAGWAARPLSRFELVPIDSKPGISTCTAKALPMIELKKKNEARRRKKGE